MTISATDNAYTAGMLDADGSIGIYQFAGNSYLSVKVNIASQDESVLRWFRKTYGGTITKAARVHIWRPSDPVAFLEQVLPYLRIKRAQAVLVLDWRKISKSKFGVLRKEEFVLKSKELNGRLPKQYVREEASTDSKSAE